MRSDPDSRLAAVVLAGGRSTRMGTPKAMIDWHGVPLLARLCERLRRVASPVVLVRAAGQQLPELPPWVERVCDEQPGRGPLEGMRVGLRAVGDRAPAAFVASADLPFLHPAFVADLAGRLGGHDAAVPIADGHQQLLTAVYRTAVLPRIETLLASGEGRVGSLLDEIDVLRLPAAELTHPESVRNVNTPEQLAAALAAETCG
jgi:molybdenum cofactor guanylyltransferase